MVVLYLTIPTKFVVPFVVPLELSPWSAPRWRVFLAVLVFKDMRLKLNLIQSRLKFIGHVISPINSFSNIFNWHETLRCAVPRRDIEL